MELKEYETVIIITYILQALRPYKNDERFDMVLIMGIIESMKNKKEFKQKLIDFIKYSDEKGENA